MIRRFAFLVFAWTLLAACGKDDMPEPVWISAQPEVLLAGSEGSEATFDVTARGAWSLTISGEGFDATPRVGGAGSTSVTVRATTENPEKYRRTLGRITLQYEANGAEYTVEVLQGPVTAPQTVLLYMPGRDLELRGSFFSKNIEAIRKAVSDQVPGDGRMLVCWQPRSLDAAELYEIYYDYGTQQSEMTLLKSYDEFSAADPVCVAGMLADIEIFAPARKYGLIIGCHGKAWIPASQGAMNTYALRPGQKHEEDIWTPAPGALVTRSFGDTRHEIDIVQLAAALKAQRFRFDYLIFDACFMASIEAIYDLREAVDYYVASPCEIMGAGFPYDRTLPHLFANEGAAYDLQRVCEEFYRFYNDDWDSVPRNAQSGCISMADMSEIDALAEVMRRIHEHGTQSFELSSLQYYEGMRTHLFYDLGHYVELACDDAALKQEFAAQFDKAFPPACRLHTPSFYSEYNHQMNPVTFYSGVCTSEPSSKYTADHKLTGWYLKTHGGV